jgi:hypothetical protein
MITVKQLIENLKESPCESIISVRIEFADGSIYRDSPETRYVVDSKEQGERDHKGPSLL